MTVGAGASTPDNAFPSILVRRLHDEGFDARADQAISAFGGIYSDLVRASSIPSGASLVVVELGAHGAIENQSMPPSTYRRGYGLMLDCLLASGAAVVVGTVPSLAWKDSDPLYWRAVGVSWIVASEASARGIPVADIWNATRDRPDLVSGDHMHPGDWGHQVIADEYWRGIRWALAAARPPAVASCPYSPGDLATILR